MKTKVPLYFSARTALAAVAMSLFIQPPPSLEQKIENQASTVSQTQQTYGLNKAYPTLENLARQLTANEADKYAIMSKLKSVVQNALLEYDMPHKFKFNDKNFNVEMHSNTVVINYSAGGSDGKDIYDVNLLVYRVGTPSAFATRIG